MGVLRLEVELRGWDWCLKAGIEALRLSLEAKIWALMRGGGGEREEKGKFPVIVKAKVIGPLGAAAQKENQLTKRSTNRPTNQSTDR